MPFDITYWDEKAKKQRTRKSTPQEDAQRQADIEAAAAPVVPARIPMLNAHLEMIDAGWMDDVVAFIDALPAPQDRLARVYLDKALTMERSHQLVQMIPAALGKTEAEVDAMFIAAAARPD